MVPPSVHGNNGVAMLHSPSLIHRTNPEYSNKRSASTSSDTARSVSSPNTSPSHSPVKKFAVATEQERERDPERGYRPQGQVPQWTHIKIQTQSKGKRFALENCRSTFNLEFILFTAKYFVSRSKINLKIATWHTFKSSFPVLLNRSLLIC